MFLHAYSLHSTERIKWRLEFFADWEIIWPIIRKHLHRHRVHSLYSQLNDLILAAIEWAQRDFRFWFKVSLTQLQYIITTHTPCFFSHLFSYDSQKTNSVTHLALGFYRYKEKKNITLNMMPAEPGALIKYMRTQICTFCQSGGGFPTETRGWVSQNLNLKYKKMKWKPHFSPESKHFVW